MGYIVDDANLDYSEQTLNADARLANSDVPTVMFDDNAPTFLGSTFLGTAGEVWMQETWLGNMARYGLTPDGDNPHAYNYDYGTDWNPYKFFLDNKEEYSDIEPWIKNGFYDEVYGEQQFQDRTARLRKEAEARRAIGAGSGFGAFVGGILSIADISTFVPMVGWAKKLDTARKIPKWAGAATYYSAVQEAGLHTMQELRTAEESGLNIGASAILGGLIGGALHLKAGDPLFDPKSPKHLLHPENKVYMGVKAVGQSLSESAVFKKTESGYRAVAESPVGQSVSAAATKTYDGMLKPAGIKGKNALQTGTKALGKGLLAVSNQLSRITPIGRMLNARSAVQRQIAERLFDMGGVLTESNKHGIKVDSVEDVARGFAREFETTLLADFTESLIRIQMKLAELGGQPASRLKLWANDQLDAAKGFTKDLLGGTSRDAKLKDTTTPVPKEGRLNEAEFESLITLAGEGRLTTEHATNLRNRFGDDGAQMIMDEVDRYVKSIQKWNDDLFDKALEVGLVKESDKVDNYFMPHLYDAAAIRKNYKAVKNFFMEKFGGKPSDEFLEDFGINRDQFDKLGLEEVTVPVAGKDKKLSPEQGEVYKQELLEEWSGELYRTKLQQIESDLIDAQDEYAALKQTVMLLAREVRSSTAQFKNASIKEAQSVLNERHVQLEMKKAKLELMRIEQQAAKERLAFEESRLNDAMNMEIDAGAALTKATRAAARRVKQLEKLRKKWDGNNTMTKAIDEELNIADNELRYLKEQDVNAAHDKAFNNPTLSAKTQVLRDRLKKLEQQTIRGEKRIAALEPRIIKLREKLGEAMKAKDAVAYVKKLRERALKEDKKAKNKASRDVKRLTKRMNKAEKAPALHEYVENLMQNLSKGSGRLPMGIVPREMFESGRAKTRMIHYTPEELTELRRLGALRSDTMQLLLHSANDLGRRIALKRVFSEHDGDESAIITKVKESVRDDYDAIIDKAKMDGKTQRHINKLEAERDKMVEFTGNSIKKVMGVLDMPDNPQGLLTWLGSKAREFNFIRYGSGFLIPSLTDPANVMLTSGFKTLAYRNLRTLRSTLKGMSNDELRRLGMSLEMLLHNSREMKINNVDDMRMLSGIGDYGTIKHYSTASVDRILNYLTKTTSYASGMVWWNSRWKMLAMVEMQHKFAETAAKYDKLFADASAGDKEAEKIVAQFASLGLGAEEMRLITKMMNKYPPEVGVEGGSLELGMSRWLDEGRDGIRAHEFVMNALEHTANRAIMTPGRGDTPLFMSTQHGKIIMQFQTYGFAILNRYMTPAFQRMANYGDLEALSTIALNVGLGTAVVYIKDLLNHGEIKERDATQWAYDVIDRSGMTTYMSPLIAEVLKHTSGDMPSRYTAERNRWTLLGGATGGLLQDGLDLKDAVVAGDGERAGKVAQKLAPFKIYSQMYNLVTDDN